MLALLLISFYVPFVFCTHEAIQWRRIQEHDEVLNQDVTFHVALKQNQPGLGYLKDYLLNHLSNIDSPHYGQYLTPSEIGELVNPPRSVQNIVSNWLQKNNINCKSLGDAYRCHASVKSVGELFLVRMSLYHNFVTEQTKLRADRAYALPDHIKEYVDFVDGISNPLPISHKPKFSVLGENDDVDKGGFSREVMMRLYNMPDVTTDGSVSVGAMEYDSSAYGDGFSNKDLLNSQIGNGVSTNPITIDHIVGINGDFPDVESELDVQTMYWGAPNATLWYDVNSKWMYSWSVDFFNRANVPEVASISWGFDETEQCDIIPCENTTSKAYVTRCNTEFMKIAARGITLVVASGDAGSPGFNYVCYSAKGPYGWNHINADFPAGSPWVLSVGATYIVANNQTTQYNTPICTKYSEFNISCATGVEERGVWFNKTHWTTGGAFTHWDTQPSWQTEVVKQYLQANITMPQSQYFNANGRAYPDVSAVGHNCLVNVRDGTGLGRWRYVDGTSCSAPVFAGIITQLNYYQKQRGKPALGFINPLLYKMASETPKAFNDVIEGNTQCSDAICCYNEKYCCTKDFGFQATKGWDPVGGLGTPNVRTMLAYLASH